MIDRSDVLNLELIDRIGRAARRTPSRCNATRPALRLRRVPAVA
jgi:hypothetical protein